ncbi:MAG: S-layer homology domain-containing protein, partial [Alistipes sp.]|nr:S-layer homology domain-containing protein [Alistipes sp.]
AAVEYIWRYAKSPSAAEVSFSDVKTGTTTAKAVSWAVGYGVTNGTSATTFSPNSTCTRAQIVTFLHRYFVEPLATTPAPAPAPTDSWKLDPLPPEDYKKHPDWYMSLTPVGEMSNAQLVAESDSIAAVIADYRARDAYITDSMLVRKDDIMYQIMERAEIVRRYDQAVEYNKKYGLKIDQSDIDDYENLVAKWGDPELLRGN